MASWYRLLDDAESAAAGVAAAMADNAEGEGRAAFSVPLRAARLPAVAPTASAAMAPHRLRRRRARLLRSTVA